MARLTIRPLVAGPRRFPSRRFPIFYDQPVREADHPTGASGKLPPAAFRTSTGLRVPLSVSGCVAVDWRGPLDRSRVH